MATPDAFVTAVVTPPANVPLAPLAGAANDTVTPAIGLLPASVTVACNCVANAVLIGALCGVPAVAVICAGTGFTVNEADSCCAPVKTLIVRGPASALPATWMVAVALVALSTCNGPAVPAAAPPTEIPGPKFATVEF